MSGFLKLAHRPQVWRKLDIKMKTTTHSKMKSIAESLIDERFFFSSTSGFQASVN